MQTELEQDFKRFSSFYALISLLLGCIAFPFLGLEVLRNLEGETPYYSLVTLGGLLGIIVYSARAMFNRAHFRTLVFYYVIFGIGMGLNAHFWQVRERNLCAVLRADPDCVFDAQGVHCAPKGGQYRGFSAGKNLCADY